MHSVIGAVVFAAFVVGCLLGASGKGQNQKEKTENSDAQHNATTKKYNISYWRQYIHSYCSHYKRNRNENRHHRNPNVAWTRRTFWVVFFYTAATFVLLIVNYLVVDAAREQATLMRGQLEVAKKTLVMSQRPWLYAKGSINFVNGTANYETLNVEIENNGNTIAADVIIITRYMSQYDYGAYAGGQARSKDIPCVESDLNHRPPTKTVAIVPKGHENIPFFARNDDDEFRRLASQFHYSIPYMAGCIKYNWPISDDEFHTKFTVKVVIKSKETGNVVVAPPPKPFNLYNIIPIGEIIYVDAD
jgi:hypothetical protein